MVFKEHFETTAVLATDLCQRCNIIGHLTLCKGYGDGNEWNNMYFLSILVDLHDWSSFSPCNLEWRSLPYSRLALGHATYKQQKREISANEEARAGHGAKYEYPRVCDSVN